MIETLLWYPRTRYILFNAASNESYNIHQPHCHSCYVPSDGRRLFCDFFPLVIKDGEGVSFTVPDEGRDLKMPFALGIDNMGMAGLWIPFANGLLLAPEVDVTIPATILVLGLARNHASYLLRV